ncbi:MAG: hypothetical protein WA047_20405 [Phenylobacterium sp.]|uniref:hypothetical protein n=1 Tax=Phenylobacterium sp. TaxID=1871053 RepID=UPI003BB4F70F
MGSQIEAADAAKALHRQTGYGVAVAFVRPDETGDGAYVQLAYGHLPSEDGEYVASTLLRDIKRVMEENPHRCDACLARMARITDALAILERDGGVPTGRKPGGVH